jgi:predicted aconitase with swiveling domain
VSSSFSQTMSSEPVPPDPTEQYIHPEDPDDEWASAPAGRGIRVRVITGALLVLAVLAGGFWGGVVAEKHHSSSTSASAAASALASRFAALRGGTGSGSGASGFAGAASGGAATTGLVTEVQGNVLYVTENDAAGTLVKVTVGPSTTITRTAKSSLSGLQQGDTVVVTGTKGTGGAVSATAIRATGQGVTTGGGLGAGGAFGSGGGFGRAGGAGAGSGGAGGSGSGSGGSGSGSGG